MSIKGVTDVRVRYEDRSLDVTFDDALMSEQRIISAIGREMGLALEAAPHGAAKEGSVADTCPM